jgi:N-acetylneuraminate lyase
MGADGALRLEVVEKQAEHMVRNGIAAVFVGGSTGESHSLTVEERLLLAERWGNVLRGSPLRMVVHVGTNCLNDARRLAQQAVKVGAEAISALAPSYFKPKSIEVLIDCCAEIASAAPELPFYFYDIPVLTGVQFSMPAFLEQASKRIPNLVGLKFTNSDLAAYLRVLQMDDGRFDVPWGIDEHLLGALATGAQGAVGSSYNFAAPIYLRLIEAFRAGDMARAREEQMRSVQWIETLAGFGYMAAAKATMGYLGVEVGPPRLPNSKLTTQQHRELMEAIEKLSD